MYQYINHDKNLKLVIEFAGEDIGYYLIAYHLDSDKTFADYLQDTLEAAFDDAEEYFGVLKSEWNESK